MSCFAICLSATGKQSPHGHHRDYTMTIHNNTVRKTYSDRQRTVAQSWLKSILCQSDMVVIAKMPTVLVSAATGNKSAMQPPLPPPRCGGEWKERGRKLVGRDKGSLTEQQTEGTATTTIQIRGTHRTDCTTPQTCSPGQDQRRMLPSRKSVPAVQRRPSPPEPSVTSHGMEYRALFSQVGSASTPRLCPFLKSGENEPFPGQTQDTNKKDKHLQIQVFKIISILQSSFDHHIRT